MTHDYKAALDEFGKSHESGTTYRISPSLDCTIRHALQLAQEAEQLRKERDELADAIIKIHEDQEGDYDFLKFISHPQYILANKVRNENGNA